MIFCVVDTETTGLAADYHEVIQVAAIICNKNFEESASVSFKIRPRFIERASKKALEVNGYHPRTWNPDFISHKEALLHLNKFIANNNKFDESVIMAGQNIGFDYDFLKVEYDRTGILFPFNVKMFDLMSVAKIWAHLKDTRLKKLSLKYLTEFTGQINTNPHDAEADARATMGVIKWFVDDLKRGSKDEKRTFYKHSSLKI